MRSIAIVVATVLVATSVDARAQTHDPTLPQPIERPHVRSENPVIRRLIERGLLQSLTFRRLVDELNASDVIVHLERRYIRDGIRGELVHRVVESNGFRYLRIVIDSRGTDRRVIPIIAHELQHAVEVARASEVGRSQRIDDFFLRIADDKCAAPMCVETAAAIEVQRHVARELD